MSLLARHRYMVQRVADAFGYADEEPVENMMLASDILQGIDFFFSFEGPRKIILTIVEEEEKLKEKATHHKKRAHANTSQGKETRKIMKIFFNDVEVLPNVAVYFMKARRHSDDDSPREIDATKVDTSMSFGIMRAPLKSLEVLMRCVYRPMIQTMEDEAWGDTKPEQQNEFVQSIDLFSKGLEDSIRNLTGGIELKKPDERVETLGHAAANDPELVIRSLNLLDDWCRSIETYLDDSSRAESMESGPDTELIFWRSRMQRLASITEQLKNKSVSVVISLLSYVARPHSMIDPSIDSQRVASLLAQVSGQSPPLSSPFPSSSPLSRSSPPCVLPAAPLILSTPSRTSCAAYNSPSFSYATLPLPAHPPFLTHISPHPPYPLHPTPPHLTPTSGARSTSKSPKPPTRPRTTSSTSPPWSDSSTPCTAMNRAPSLTLYPP